MNTKLQQAIAATRDGDKQQAQRLLAELLKENPQDAQAWFLLSHLVESESKQVAYLSKVLTLQPTHEKAKQRLAQLTSAVPVPPAVTLPPAAEMEKMVTPPAVTSEVVVQPPPAVKPPLAKPEAEKPAPAKAETVKTPPPPLPKPPAAAKPPLSKKAMAAQAKRQKQQQQYNYMMIGLAVIAVLILLLIISQLF